LYILVGSFSCNAFWYCTYASLQALKHLFQVGPVSESNEEERAQKRGINGSFRSSSHK
jgi:hypothetical protein